MKRIVILFFILSNFFSQIAAQQNWAAIPCSKMNETDYINRMFVDSLHNEIILYSLVGSTVCNTTYKGIVAYNGNSFHDLSKGIDTHNPNPTANGAPVWGCIRYGNKTLFGGGFLSVGTNTVYAKSIALWDGSVWDTFPTHVFDNAPNWNSGGAFYGFLRWNGKLWMYGVFDKIGSTITKNLAAYDGYTYTAVPSIPASNYTLINKMVVYKNKLIATGNFYDSPSYDFFRLAQFDGTSWSEVGNGIGGSFSNCQDMVVFNDTLYIAGAFPKSAGNAGNYIMKWDGTQLSDAGFGGFCGYGPVTSLIPYKNRLYAFGGFACAANQKAFGVAYYENGVWTVPQDSIEGPSIIGAVLYNDAIYIGGGFKSINGDTTIQKFAKLVCPDFDAANGCISGLKETSSKFDFKVFPNPAKDKLNVEFEHISDTDKLTITNVLGQELFKVIKPSLKQEIDISWLAPGIYFLRAENKYKQGVYKIVKE